MLTLPDFLLTLALGSAYHQGRIAAELGQPRAGNPYLEATPRTRRAWFIGFDRKAAAIRAISGRQRWLAARV